MSAVTIGAVVSLLGLVGLVLAEGAMDGGMYHFGPDLFGLRWSMSSG